MIHAISICLPTGKKEVVFDHSHPFKVMLSLEPFLSHCLVSFDLEITLAFPIMHFRSYDYQWIDADSDWVANEFCPKIIKLSNGIIVQAAILGGIWEVHAKNKSVLLWRFNPQYAATITNYSSPHNDRNLAPAIPNFSALPPLALLFSTQNAIEFSRSKIPFSPIVCFTDHCDFDTAENLELQRVFFKEKGIKVTKGFFLRHFSKRSDNASYEKEASELLQWKADGHELCYHSLTQSLLSREESLAFFLNFNPPFSDIPTWIDHGYQPYNLSLFEQQQIAPADFETNLVNKNIRILWNYIDSGTATKGVINQLNTQHFTLRSFLKGNNDLGLYKKAQLIIKNIVFHFYGTPKILAQYRKVAGDFKKFWFQKDFKSLFSLLKKGSDLMYQIVQVFLFWNTAQKKPYSLAHYQPLFFKHTLKNRDFFIFQTLEMLDFKKALCPENIDLLIKEKGLFIAHTYFSVPLAYHSGKMFNTPNTIDPEVAQNFKLLGQKIKDNTIWNPTLQEWIEYWSKADEIVLNVNQNGVIFVQQPTDIKYRIIK